jgi:hypothetical protein
VRLDVLADAEAVYVLTVGCAEQVLEKSAGRVSIRDADTPLLYYGPVGSEDQSGLEPVTLECPLGTMVTELRGTTWILEGGVISLKQLTIVCSQLTVDAQHTVQFNPGGELSVGRVEGSKAEYTDACPPGHVAVGVGGREDLALNAIQLQCAPIALVSSTQP